MMKKADLAYMAGIMDGEGCVRINKDSKRYQRPEFQLTVAIASTDQWLPYYLQSHWGGAVYCHHEKASWKDRWQWTTSGPTAYTFLRAILPFTKLKREQIKIALKFQATKERRRVKGSEGFSHRTDDECAIEEAQYTEIKAMKSRSLPWKPSHKEPRLVDNDQVQLGMSLSHLRQSRLIPNIIRN